MADVTEPSSPPGTRAVARRVPAPPRERSAALALAGFVLGMLLWAGADVATGNPLNLGFWDALPPLMGAAGAVLALTRARALFWIAGAAVCLLWLVVGWTPVIAGPTQGLVREDPLHPADAVVVLSANMQADGDPDDVAQERILRGLEVLRQGLAPRLVLTRIRVRKHSSVPHVQGLMRRLDFQYPILETPPVHNTHDEAVQVAELARRHGWRSVILVTSPTHTRRAAATFRKAGVPVSVTPCTERGFDLETLESPVDRLRAFRAWLHEVLGYEAYRRRGWV